MAWLVKDKETSVCCIFNVKPIRKKNYWTLPYDGDYSLMDFTCLDIDTVNNIFNINPKWENEPIEIGVL